MTKRIIGGAVVIGAAAVIGLAASACNAEEHAAGAGTQVGGAHVTLGTYVGDGYVLVDLDPANGVQLLAGADDSGAAVVQVIQHGDALPACATEDAIGPCFWDASLSGNGTGHSFYVDATGVHYIGQ